MESALNIGDLVRKDLIRGFFFDVIDEDIDILLRRQLAIPHHVEKGPPNEGSSELTLNQVEFFL